MDICKWDNTLSVGVPAIDRDHQKLIGLINELALANRARNGSEVFRSVLERLALFGHDHLVVEEEFLSALPHPMLEQHGAEHQYLCTQANAFVNCLEERPEHIEDVLYFMTRWLLDHIESDKKCFALLRAENVSA